MNGWNRYRSLTQRTAGKEQGWNIWENRKTENSKEKNDPTEGPC